MHSKLLIYFHLTYRFFFIRISRFLQRFPELKQRKEQLGTSETIVSKNYFSETSIHNPFRKETVRPEGGSKYVDIEKLDGQ